MPKDRTFLLYIKVFMLRLACMSCGINNNCNIPNLNT